MGIAPAPEKKRRKKEGKIQFAVNVGIAPAPGKWILFLSSSQMTAANLAVFTFGNICWVYCLLEV